MDASLAGICLWKKACAQPQTTMALDFSPDVIIIGEINYYKEIVESPKLRGCRFSRHKTQSALW
jgi:hypothetical protein